MCEHVRACVSMCVPAFIYMFKRNVVLACDMGSRSAPLHLSVECLLKGKECAEYRKALAGRDQADEPPAEVEVEADEPQDVY